MDIDSLYNFYNGKKVLVTGHTGFKGSWLCMLLHRMGAKLYGMSLRPEKESLYAMARVHGLMEEEAFRDIGRPHNVCVISSEWKPDVVLHLAAQPLVLESYRNPVATYGTNLMGTLNILEEIRKTPSIVSSVLITTDKVYDNKESLHPYKETDPFGGYDPYSSSKGCCEIAINSWRQSFRMEHLASARAGNVIGGGDFAENRIVPDWARALKTRTRLQVRNPNSVRPFQHVLEPLFGYLVLGKMVAEDDTLSGGWNFGPSVDEVHKVSELLELLNKGLDKEIVDPVLIEYDTKEYPHEANLLRLDITKAMTKLDWKPVWNLEDTARNVARWYGLWCMGANAYEACLRDIAEYEEGAMNDE